MKIQICSDLHLEFASNKNWLKHHPLIPKGDILIIAGDTYHLDKDYKNLDFISKVSESFEQVYIIPGNHEYYGGFDISSTLVPTYRTVKENVFIVNNHALEIEGINFIFSTMWSEIKSNILAINQGLLDFRRIKYNNERFTINHFNEIHEYAFKFLSNEIKKEGRKVVITHHLPSKQCNSKEFSESLLNEGFCVDKTNFILNSEIDYWIYGHSHRNLNDFKIGNTKMITNQFGYVDWNEHHSFNYEKVIDLN
jgi:DNA repair exonuclease SbcCD nuclease subunit